MAATYKAITATGQVNIGPCRLMGMFCSSATTPTLEIHDSGLADTADPKVFPSFVPVAATNYPLPTGGVNFSKGIYAVIGGTLTMTFFYEG